MRKKTMIQHGPDPTTVCPIQPPQDYPLNGRTAPPVGPLPVTDPDGPPREWVEADRIVVHLILAKKRGTHTHSVKVGEVNYLDREQRPITLFADAEDRAHPWGTAVEAFIAQAEMQGNAQLQEASE